jgi:hypothetical protein
LLCATRRDAPTGRFDVIGPGSSAASRQLAVVAGAAGLLVGSRRLAALFAVVLVALVAGGVVPAAFARADLARSQARDGCPSASAPRTLARDHQAIVYRAAGARSVLACIKRSGAVQRLVSGRRAARVSAVRLRGTYVGWLDGQCGKTCGCLQVLDLVRHEKLIHDGCAAVAFVLGPSGSAAWASPAAGQPPGSYEVHIADQSGEREVDSGASLSPGSLRLDGATVSWINGADQRSAPLLSDRSARCHARNATAVINHGDGRVYAVSTRRHVRYLACLRTTGRVTPIAAPWNALVSLAAPFVAVIGPPPGSFRCPASGRTLTLYDLRTGTQTYATSVELPSRLALSATGAVAWTQDDFCPDPARSSVYLHDLRGTRVVDDSLNPNTWEQATGTPDINTLTFGDGTLTWYHSGQLRSAQVFE